MAKSFRLAAKFFFFSFLFLFLVGCVPDDGKVKVGAILPLSGSFAFVGDDSQKAIELALEETGNKIDVIFEDSAGENTKAVAAYNKLVNIDNTKIVITSASWISNAVYPQAANDGIVQVILASAAFERTKEDKAVRFTVDVADEIPYVVDYLNQFGKIAVLHMNNDYGQDWADAITQNMDDKIVAIESYTPGDQEVNTQLTKIKAANPDMLVLVSTGKEGSLFARKAREKGIEAQLSGQRPMQGPELLKEPAADGLVYSFPAHDLNHSFIAKFTEKYSKEPSIFAVEAYDSIIKLTEAVDECISDAACLHDWFQNNSYDGALGHVTFDDKGDAHYPFVLKQVKNGEFVLLE